MMASDLALLNPLPVGDESLVDSARREADLQRILEQPRAGAAAASETKAGRQIPRRVALGGLAAAGVAALVVAGVPLVPGSKPASAFAATPPVLPGWLGAGQPAGPALTSLAAIADSSSAEGTLGSRYSTWSLFTRVVNDQPVRSAVVPQDVDFTLAANGSGHRTVRIGAVEVPAGGDASDLDLPAAGTVTRDEGYAAGQTPRVYDQPLSSDPTTLWAQLTQAHPIAELGTGELFVAITDLFKEQRPAAAVRAQLLRLLAQRPDVVDLGIVYDRAGRAGRGIGVSSSQPGGLPARFVLIFDPSSGAVWGYEQILTSSSGKLDVKIPSVIDYALFR